jgi:hypothetical protein
VYVLEEFTEELSHFSLGRHQGFSSRWRCPIELPVPPPVLLLAGYQESAFFQRME